MRGKTQKRTYGGVYRHLKKTKKVKRYPIGYEPPRKEYTNKFAKKGPQPIMTHLQNVVMKESTRSKRLKPIAPINLKSAVPMREGTTYEYIKSVQRILRQLLLNSNRVENGGDETYDLLVLMGIEIANTLQSIQEDLGLNTNLNKNSENNSENSSENSSENKSENNSENIFENVQKVYTILTEQIELYKKVLKRGDMNDITQLESYLENIAITLDGALQEAKNQIAPSPRENAEVDDLLRMMNALKPFRV